MPIQHITELFVLEGKDFITEAYHNLLNREPDAQGISYYLGRLSMGCGKASVITDLASSEESRPYHEIIGLEKLIMTERRANHWLWGRFSSRQYQLNLLREGIQGVVRITALLESLIQRMEDLQSFVKSNQLHVASKDQCLLSTNDVRLAYLEILGREPENDQVIAYHARCESVEALRQGLFESEEFKCRINMERLAPGHMKQERGACGEDAVLDPHAKEIYLELKSLLLNNTNGSLGEV